MSRHRYGRPDVMCASDMAIYQDGADNLSVSGLPEDVVVSGIGILGDSAVVLQARQRAQQFKDAAESELEVAERFEKKVGERAETLDPRVLSFLPGDLRNIITESLAEHTS